MDKVSLAAMNTNLLDFGFGEFDIRHSHPEAIVAFHRTKSLIPGSLPGRKEHNSITEFATSFNLGFRCWHNAALTRCAPHGKSVLLSRQYSQLGRVLNKKPILHCLDIADYTIKT